jgi:hypothetical protein
MIGGGLGRGLSGMICQYIAVIRISSRCVTDRDPQGDEGYALSHIRLPVGAVVGIDVGLSVGACVGSVVGASVGA